MGGLRTRWSCYGGAEGPSVLDVEEPGGGGGDNLLQALPVG